MQKNYNSGGVVADESGQDACTAHVTLYHDPEHPSYLELPLVTTRRDSGSSRSREQAASPARHFRNLSTGAL